MSVLAADTPLDTTAAARAGAWEQTETLWRGRIRSAQEARKPYEPLWLLSLAFVAGRQWAIIDRYTRTLRDISDVDDRYADVDLYVADIIHEHRGAALGELQTDSDRPELVLPGNGDEDEESQRIADQANRVLGYGWDYEWNGDRVLRQARQFCVDLGVAAVRCRFDPLAGAPIKGSDGNPVDAPIDPATGRQIVDAKKAREYVLGEQEAGRTATFKTLREGRVTWEAGTAFNLLTPPGIPHEDKFPWEIWVEAAPLDDVKAIYPRAADLEPDSDIGSALGVTIDQRNGGGRGDTAARVTDSVWLFTCYQRPTRRYPDGRKAVLAGRDMRLLETRDELEYRRGNGDPHSGIVYLHWQRLTDRVWSRGLIEALKDPQRMTNRVATQQQEIVDRGMPSTFYEEGSITTMPAGVPGEWVGVKPGSVPPKRDQGWGPGDWLYKHREQLLEDASHASTIAALRLGQNPSSVTTYSQLRLLYEAESGKRSSIRSEHQEQIELLAELSLETVQRYWPEGKQLAIAGEQNRLQAVKFSRSMVPVGLIVRPAKGAPRPRSEAAHTQLIADLWTAAVNSGAATGNPNAWMKWLADSYDAGEPLPLPKPPNDVWQDKAEFENRDLVAGKDAPVAYYDPAQVHIPIHRRAQDEAMISGDTAAWQALERHILEHMRVADGIRAATVPAPAALPAPAEGQPAASGPPTSTPKPAGDQPLTAPAP